MQIYLTMPDSLFEQLPAERQKFLADLKAVLETSLVSAALIERHDLSEGDYKDLVGQIAPIIQTHECALLLDGSPALVRDLKADGVHVTSGQRGFSEATNALKPDFIVGAGNINSRHEAMLRGEAGADYLSFGSPVRPPETEQIELAQWWSEMFEIPCVLFYPSTPLDRLVPIRCEFIGLGENLWSDPAGPAAAIRTFAKGAGGS
ncbi:hypothetical protein MNBD_ALPHA12-2252 [hydrothermal vent metagenome]|uniref:Thiamine phosphate synthase/TenI domain-containing protein n=1 Tax=hydrothermal vent metagenome TaxID=652676 RepID=A0A3B0TI02_9ZZZZ